MNWHVTGRAIFVVAALLLSATFWMVAWGYTGDGQFTANPQLTGWDLFSSIWASFQQNPQGTDIIRVGWVILAPVATLIAAVSAIGGPPSRTLTIIGGAAFIAAPLFIGLIFDAANGQIAAGVFATAGLAIVLIILGCSVPRTAPKQRAY